MTLHDWQTNDSKKWAARYRELVAQQKRMPLDTKWTLAPLIKEARANFLIEKEYERTGIRGT